MAKPSTYKEFTRLTASLDREIDEKQVWQDMLCDDEITKRLAERPFQLNTTERIQVGRLMRHYDVSKTEVWMAVGRVAERLAEEKYGEA